MTRRRQAGFTVLEAIIALSLFVVFMFLLAQLTAEMRGYEKRLPVNWLAHPQVGAVLARLRHDVLDSTAPYYPGTFETYNQSPSVLIVYSLQESGFAQHVVWDFSTSGQVTRRTFSAGNMTSEWTARGLPSFIVGDYPIANHPDSVRIKAFDAKGLLAIDQILQPRAHE